ncbi:MAG: PAS domain-containing protein [Timaviella obliquedivisa GSE-PSE-MK23-08B]|nr:PAS domain-containing protein [Timaviella obliquedivisa GSE-PSE-MK23-08B]
MSSLSPEKPLTLSVPTNEAERLAALYRYRILDTPPEAAFDRITALAVRLFDTPVALVSLVDKSRAWFKSCIGFSNHEVPRESAPCSFAVLKDVPLIVLDTLQDDRFACTPLVQDEPGVRFYAGAPLLTHDGFNLGTLCVVDTRPHDSMSLEQQATLVDLAAMVVDELELRLAAYQIAQVDTALLEVTKGIATVTGEAFFQALTQHFSKVLGTDYIYIGLVEGDVNVMMRPIATCAHGQMIDHPACPLPGSPCEEVVKQRTICCYPSGVQAVFPNVPLLKLLDVESYMGTPFFDSKGTLLGVLGVMHGKPLENIQLAQTLLSLFAPRISTELERQQTEVELRQAAERMSAAQHCAKAGLWSWDIITNEVYWSPEYYTLWSISPNISAAYDTWLNAIVEEDRDRVRQHIQAAVAQQQPIQVEYRYLHPERGLCWFMSIGNTLYSAENQPLRATGISLDVTDRKQVEEELLQKNAILNVINESAPTPIFVKDRQGRIIYGNPATFEVLGKSASEVIGFRDGDLFPDLEDAARVMANDQRIMEAGQTEVVEESPDGVRTFLGMKSPYRNKSGEVIGLIGIASDISDRVQLERDRERVLQQEQAARESAETANRIKDEFLAVLSHELRSPLNPILGWTKLLQSGNLDQEKTAHALETIERNVKLQSELIEDLLDVSRILQSKLSLNISSVNLGLTIEAAIETVSLAAQTKSIKINTTLDPEIGQVLGDASRLQQIVWNLVSNAVKFTPEGGRIEVRLTRFDHQAQITVTDTGKGITAEFLPHVFDYFRQEDSATTRRFGGLGLGLAIVRHLVELHGGTVQVTSPGEDQGTTFTVSIPLAESANGQGVESQKTFSARTNKNSLLGIRVLVVDDEPDMRDVIAFSLEQSGAEVIAVGTAMKALEALAQFQPDILVSDVGMPDMDGYMLMQRIRALNSEQGGQVKAIALTAYAAEFDQNQALQAGFQQHLAKPVEPEVLVRAIVRLFKSNA